MSKSKATNSTIDLPIRGYVLDGILYGEEPSNVKIINYEVTKDGTSAIAYCKKKSKGLSIALPIIIVSLIVAIAVMLINGKGSTSVSVSVPDTMYYASGIIESNIHYDAASGNPLTVTLKSPEGITLVEPVTINPGEELLYMDCITDYFRPGDSIVCNLSLSTKSWFSEVSEVATVLIINNELGE